jgi:hypothetical protein
MRNIFVWFLPANTLKDRNKTEPVCDSKHIDMMLKFYDSSRAEAIQRIVLRDSALMFYIASMGAYMSYMINHHFYCQSNDGHDLCTDDIKTSLALIVPLPMVSLIFTLVILHHHYFINRIGRFLSDELKFPTPYNKIPHWDTSRALNTQRGIDFGFRLIAQAGILCSPMLYDGLFFSKYYDKIMMSGILNITAAAVIVSVSFIVYIFIIYMHFDIHRKIKEEIVLLQDQFPS